MNGPICEDAEQAAHVQLDLESIVGKTREAAIKAAAPHIDFDGVPFKKSLAVIDKIAAEEKDKRAGALLCPAQDEISLEFNEEGDLLLVQKHWPDDDDVIRIAAGNIAEFIDRLTDAIGIPTFGGPSK